MMEELSEQIQNDLICLLDGYPEELVTAACQIVVDRIKQQKEQDESLQK